MSGLYFEEFSVGQTFDHSIRRTVTEADNVLLTTMTHNPASLHLDAEYMKSTPYGKPLVNSCLTLSLMVSPGTPDDRAAVIAKRCTGFVYLLARSGITGEREEAPDIADRVLRTKPWLDKLADSAGLTIELPPFGQPMLLY